MGLNLVFKRHLHVNHFFVNTTFTGILFAIILVFVVSTTRATALIQGEDSVSAPLIELKLQDNNKFTFTLTMETGIKIPVWGYQPSTYSKYSKNTPVVFVMHGTKRDADRYRDEWTEFAEKYQFLLIVPEFSKNEFPKANGYNLGNVFENENLRVNPKIKWSFSAIEPIFDRVKNLFNNDSEKYSLYGHSAGSQFVHRFLYFVPDARLKVAVTANAGWYTMPDFTQDFPYGLNNTPLNTSALDRVLQQKVIVLLGTADNDPNHRSLRRAEQAMLQGTHRFERGQSFYQMAEQYAKNREIPFNWDLVFAPNIAHENAKMASFAAPLLVSPSQ